MSNEYEHRWFDLHTDRSKYVVLVNPTASIDVREIKAAIQFFQPLLMIVIFSEVK